MAHGMYSINNKVNTDNAAGCLNGVKSYTTIKNKCEPTIIVNVKASTMKNEQ